MFCLTLLSVTASGANWVQVWSDEFNAPANTPPDPRWWNYDTGGGGWGNNELECYTTSTNNVRQDGAGHLLIQARYEPSCNGRNWSSGRINSSGKFDFAYGKAEAYAMIPKGQGVWPAFWMIGNNIGSVGWPACGENDIMENMGWGSNWIQSTLHGPGYSGGGGIGKQYYHPNGWAFGDTYHLYGMEWDPNQIRFYVDGVQFQTVTPAMASGTWVFDHPFFFIFNLAMGGNWPGNPDGSTPDPSNYLIDYVRVYQDADRQRAFNGNPQSIPGRVEMEAYDEGGYGLAYMDSDPVQSGGAFRSNEWVDIENNAGVMDLGYTHAGEWVNYTVNAAQTGAYSFRASVASAVDGGTFHLEVDGVNVSGAQTLPNTGGWGAWGSVTVTGININAGSHVLKLVMDTNGVGGGVGNFDYIDFWIPVLVPTFTSTTLPTKTGTPTRTATPSGTRTGSPTPTSTRTGTAAPSFTATPSPTETRTLTGTLTCTATFTASPTLSPSSSATASFSATGTITQSPTPPPPGSTSTSTGIQTGTFTRTSTSSPSSSSSPTPSVSSSPTLTPTATNTVMPASTTPTATSTPTPTGTSTGTSTVTSIGTLSSTATATASPTPTSSSTPQPLASASSTTLSTPAPASSAVTGEGHELRVEQACGLPNPNPRCLNLLLSGPADSVEFEVFSAGTTLTYRGHAQARPGWNQVELGLAALANGVYYVRVVTKAGSRVSGPKTAKILVLK